MPIKLPKGFARRKSSGNALGEIPEGSSSSNRDSVSSFRVLARPNSTARALDTGSASQQQQQQQQPMEGRSQPRAKSSFELDSEDLFSVARNDATNRGSGGTANSLSTAPYDSGASSARLSTSSTNPSSVETGSGRNVKSAAQPAFDDAPAPPPHSSRGGFLKNAGRTFSFGVNRNASREANDLPPVPPIPGDKNRRNTITNARERTMTVTSVTTATPPRLDDSSFSIKSDDDDFGNMFAGLHTKPSRENLTGMKPAPLKSATRAAPPQPIHVNRSAEVESSPYSWNSQNSRDGLIGSPSPSRTVTQASPQPSALRNTMSSVRSDDDEENMFEDTPLHRPHEVVYSKPQYSPRAPPSSFPATAMNRSRAQSNAASSVRSPPIDASEFEMPQLDPTLLANAQLATQYEEKQESPAPAQSNNNKVMTPAEFERYKQQKEDTRRYNKVFGKTESDDGSGDEYEDDEQDDREREAHALKQRKKQEAHLAVYRQQMMKVTGDVPPAEPRPGTGMSDYNLTTQERRMSSLTLGGQPGFAPDKHVADDEDEDEDVPLGILAAHGFPNKNRPPTRLAGSSSNPNLRNLAQMQGGASVAGGEPGRSSLPAFARNLPADPYYGAGIVHQAERAPLQMHASSSQTHLAMQPQPSGAATAHPLHPAGLVGVIAGEERARAMRRGSPNPQTGAGFDMPMMNPPSRMPQPMQGYPPPGMMQPMLSPTEQAQLQMSQSMTQMVQMQMQWMHQMSSMMGQNQNMQMHMMNMAGMPPMGPMGPMGPMQQQQQQQNAPVSRPQSTPLQNFSQPAQRTMSTLTPSMAGWNSSAPAVPQMHQNGSVYAHSIAPSERSNIGLASRYRPVSLAVQEPENNYNKRASTFTSSTFRPWMNENNHPTSKLATSTVRTVQNADDDDDEQGWAEMQARREKKQKSWKLRKGNKDTTLQELYNAPA